MADRHVVYKQCLKEVAEQMGMSVSFMAKFATSQAGSSCHIHLSLWRDGVNAFAGDEQFGPVKCSSLFRWFLGGWIRHASEVMVLRAIEPKDNFRRFDRRDPIGLVLALMPWNYPYLCSVNVVIPAIMAGNSVILKPAAQTPLVAERYAEAFNQAGLPDGVFQVLYVTHDQVETIIRDPRIGICCVYRVSGRRTRGAAGSRGTFYRYKPGVGR